MPDDPALARVTAIERLIGHKLKHPDRIVEALTHPSSSASKGAAQNYERLEFLGDAVLSLVIVEEVFRRFYDMPEGQMTKLKISLVSGPTLREVAAGIGLAELIEFGPSERSAPERGMGSALENAFEALVGAIFIDGGLLAARRFILSTFGERIRLEQPAIIEHPKSVLQERAQARGAAPEYSIVSVEGPPHDGRFTAQVTIDGQLWGQGSGRSKKEAEMAAASEALGKYLAK